MKRRWSTVQAIYTSCHGCRQMEVFLQIFSNFIFISSYWQVDWLDNCLTWNWLFFLKLQFKYWLIKILWNTNLEVVHQMNFSGILLAYYFTSNYKKDLHNIFTYKSLHFFKQKEVSLTLITPERWDCYPEAGIFAWLKLSEENLDKFIKIMIDWM